MFIHPGWDGSQFEKLTGAQAIRTHAKPTVAAHLPLQPAGPPFGGFG
jgi:hypothetical protein